ncbi:S1/P1 Nuclease [bacterium]|nr:S1/P1 Nuclease [bacterium]
MKTQYRHLVLSLLFLLLFLLQSGFGWGFFAHKWINRLSVETLPDEIRPFFESHKMYLADHSIDPDLRVGQDPKEQYRHYIDIDMYGSFPFLELPRSFDEANKKFGDETVEKRGVAPWWIVHTYRRLIQAMRLQNPDSVIVLAAELGHYVSDLHMPLHNVENYDGQLSGNNGIHARFERWMIEKYADRIQLTVGEARYIDDPLSFIFDVVLDGVQLVDRVLNADNSAKEYGKVYDQPEDYDADYYERLYSEAGALAEKRMSDAVIAVGSFWYSAWVNAGKPDLLTKAAN